MGLPMPSFYKKKEELFMRNELQTAGVNLSEGGRVIWRMNARTR